jgi:plasmid stabilization system protein ParE
MAARRPVVWSPDAGADLSDIWDYYAQAAGRRTADKIVRVIDGRRDIDAVFDE